MCKDQHEKAKKTTVVVVLWLSLYLGQFASSNAHAHPSFSSLS
jgi:hypothetical protein